MKRKKLLALTLAASMICGLCACGSGDAGSSGDSGKETQESSTQESSAQEAENPGESQEEETDNASGGQAEGNSAFPLEEPVTLKVFIVQLPSVVELEQNSVFQDLQAYTNIDFDLTLVPGDGAAEKLNLMLASGDYPDVIIGESIMSNQDLEKYGVQEQILIPLNDLIDQYGPTIKERWAEHPSWEEEMKSSDGNIYGIPTVDSGGEGHGDCGYKMWINKEWLKAVGKEMPTTTEEFKDVLMAFKTEDPNGNGIADEIPLTGAINTWAAEPYWFLLNAFGYFNAGYYYVKDGTVQSILDQDYVKEGLKYVHDLYESGLIDPAALTQDESQMSAVGNNDGTIIAGTVSCGHIGMFVDINNAERYNQYEIMMPLKGSDGYCAIPYNLQHSVGGSTFAITDVCEHPEIAIQLADLFCGEEWTVRAQVGKQGEAWDVSDGSVVGMDGQTPAKYKYLSYKTMTEADQSKDKWDHTLRLLEPNWKNLFEVQGDIMDPTNYEARLYADTMKLKPYAADVDMLPPLNFVGDDGATYSQMSTAINDYASNAIVEFITGTRDIDNEWDDHLANLEKLKYQDMLDLIQKTIDAE